MKYLYYKYLYQRLMRFTHKHNWHKMEKNPYLEIGKVHHWCHWCGLRTVTEQKCYCHACNPISALDSSTMFMRLCPDCGNKRCPKATDHNNACTNSNEPGQEGSCY